MTAEQRFLGLERARLTRALKLLLAEGLGLRRAAVSVSLVGDATMCALNHTWRGKSRPTDVLSFPLHAAAVRSLARLEDAELGDLALCVPQAARQAATRGHTLEQECLVLLVHGLLHLVGHDHVHGGRQAALMRNEEMRLLGLLAPTHALLRCLLGPPSGS